MGISFIKRFRWRSNETWHKFWWDILPGVRVKVTWPTEGVPDPNEHYRNWLEKNVGVQGFDWDWDLVGSDFIENTLTIKLRIGKTKYASILALKWG